MHSKFVFCSCLLFLAMFPSPLHARDFVTKSGKEYKDATVSNATATGLEISYPKGVAFLKFEDLDESVQKEFGYDPAKAKAIADEEKKKREDAKKEEEKELEREKKAAAAAKAAQDAKNKQEDAKEDEVKEWLEKCKKNGVQYVFLGKIIFKEKGRPIMAFTKGLKEGEVLTGDSNFFHHKGEKYLVIADGKDIVPLKSHVKALKKIIEESQEAIKKIEEDIKEQKEKISDNKTKIKALDAQIYSDPKRYAGNSDIIGLLQKEIKKAEREIQKLGKEKVEQTKNMTAAKTALALYTKEAEKFEEWKKSPKENS